MALGGAGTLAADDLAGDDDVLPVIAVDEVGGPQGRSAQEETPVLVLWFGGRRVAGYGKLPTPEGHGMGTGGVSLGGVVGGEALEGGHGFEGGGRVGRL